MNQRIVGLIIPVIVFVSLPGASFFAFAQYDYDCPVNSYYDSSDDLCYCDSGYIVSNDRCISADTVCQDLFGFNVEYSSAYDDCLCKSGYVFNEIGTRCITFDESCQEDLGLFATYDLGTDTCFCPPGQVLSDTEESCILGSTYCKDKYGSDAVYNEDESVCETLTAGSLGSTLDDAGYPDILSQNQDKEEPWFLAILNIYTFGLLFGVTLIFYFGIRIWGDSLNKKFGVSVQQFIEGNRKKLFDDKKLLSRYGTLLIILLPFLLYLLLFSFYAAVMFALLVFMATLFLPFGQIPVWIGLAVVVLGTAFGILAGTFFLIFPPNRKPFGIKVLPKENTKLWDITKEIAKEIKSKEIDSIIITPDPGIGVYLQGNLLQRIFGSGKRILEIGMSSTYGLSLTEFRAILAHEYGHFSNRDTHWSSFTHAMGNSLLRALQATPGPSQDENEEGGIIRLVMSLNPAYWFLLAFINLYFRVTNGFSRVGEVRADMMAMELYGGKSFSDGLMKVSLYDTIFIQVIQEDMVPRFLREGKEVIHFSNLMAIIYKQAKKKDLENMKAGLLQLNQAQNLYDSHPALKVRMDYAKRYSTPKTKADTKQVSSLFDNWKKLNEDIANLYNLRLMVFRRTLEIQDEQAQNDETTEEK